MRIETMNTKMKYKTLKLGLQGALVLGGIWFILPSADVEAQGIGLRKLDEMLTPTAARVERGKKVYAAQCSQCHGNEGAGGGAAAAQFEPAPGGFTSGSFKFGGGPVQIYNVISKGELRAAAEGEDASTLTHGAFNHVAYQDRWAVAHYVRTLSPTLPSMDPADLAKGAEFEAVNGVCNPAILGPIASKVKSTDAQIARGKELYGQCSSCHGAEGAGDGPAAAALKPVPRNFKSADEKWTLGTSPLAIFNTLAQGIPGTSMAGYASIKEEDRWALVHYVRSMIPESARQESTEEEVIQVCRGLSTPPKPVAISIERAMKAMAADAPNARVLSYAKYGPAIVNPGASKTVGEAVYTQNCNSCHGSAGAGTGHLGPYGAFPPYLYLAVDRLVPAQVGGDVKEFATRSLGGVHTTLPNMSSAAQLSTSDWEGLHAYIAGFEGDGEVITTDQHQLLKDAAAAATTPEGEAVPTEKPAEAKPSDGSQE